MTYGNLTFPKATGIYLLNEFFPRSTARFFPDPTPFDQTQGELDSVSRGGLSPLKRQSTSSKFAL
ncbi:MAG: hypothetical protein FJZ86_11670 [Chloroflexi bacterium]|nr:hypothetical protein [Chloroflexota bacterium]